ncbi:nucleoside monophosphate kinase [Candidatus Uhrbacteria bacterium]|nr:nucleoside monophosphate kinase [Candidatus Uhrbacteria bacterium]
MSSTSSNGAKYILLFGPQGSGKGTQGEGLAQHFGIPLIGMGALLREESKKETPRGRTLVETLKTGNLVPEAITNAVLFERLAAPDAASGFILDGYPRNRIQEEAFRAFLTTLRGGTTLTHALVLEIADAFALERLSGRRTCGTCQAVYHVKNLPPKVEGICDRCGGALIQRSDETQEATLKRLSIYRRDTESLFRAYEQDGILRRVDGSGSIETVQRMLIKAIEE